MLDSFEITNIQNENFKSNVKLNDELYFNYDKTEHIHRATLDGKEIICYGYCFDVRNPEERTIDTLNTLVRNSDEFKTNFRFLNGHYILLFNFDSTWKMITDAVSMTPVYVDVENRKVLVEDFEGSNSINGFNILNLNEFSFERIDIQTNRLTNENLERKILDLVSVQYNYFANKSITLNFRRNNMNKALISILYPVLNNQTLNLRESDSLTHKVGSWLARDFKMNVIDETSDPITDYMANVHLLGFNSFINKELPLTESEYQEFENEMGIKESYPNRVKAEFNLLNNLNYRNERKPFLMYDPFNVVEIQAVIYNFIHDKKFRPLNRIIKILYPSIDF